MTLRLRTPQRPRRSSADSEDRFQFLVTVGFIVVIVAVVLILVAAVGINYYNAHFKAVATVEGQGITRDDWADRITLTLFRIDRAEAQLREAVASGQLDEATAASRQQSLQQAADNAGQQAVEDLIDLTFQEKLAQGRGISVTDADIDAAIAKESSTGERRQVQAIFVEPETDEAGAVPTAEQDAAARETAESALAAMEDGMPFAQAAQIYSTDISSENNGEYGIITAENETDAEWVEAVFELEVGERTEVIKGEDGIYRIGQVSRIYPATNDPNFLTQLDTRLNRAAYRDNVRSETYAERLRDQVTDEALAGDVEQVHLSDIFIQGTAFDEAADPETVSPGDEIRASHILYSPNDDAQAAGTLPDDDPAWAEAEAEADDATGRVTAIGDIPERELAFGGIATAESDDEGSGAQGGDLGWFTRDAMVPEFADPLFDDEELERGDIIGPVRSDFGWHVIMFIDRRAPTQDRVGEVEDALAASGADFADVARDLSDGDEAADGGDLGWLIRQQVPEDAQEAVFALRPGETTRATFVDTGDETTTGYHFYRVDERGPRALDAQQKTLLRDSAFSDWYADETAKAEEEGRIVRDPEIFTPTDPNTDPTIQ